MSYEDTAYVGGIARKTLLHSFAGLFSSTMATTSTQGTLRF